MRLRQFCLFALAFILSLLALNAYADSLGPNLSTFAVLGAAAVTNDSGTGAPTIITGNLGSATSCTGFPAPCTGGPGIVIGTIDPLNAALAQGELTTAYNSLALLPVTGSISAGGLSGASPTPGVYDVTSTDFDLPDNSTLTLNGTGTWVFLMSSSLITGSDTTVDVSGVGAGSSVYWIVRSAATLGDNADFAGNILALDQIAFDPGAQDLCGRALSRTAGVTFAGAKPATITGRPNEVGGGCASSGGLSGGPAPVPEPSTVLLLASGLIGVAARIRRARARE